MILDNRALEAAVRECARITAPNITDEIFARERDANSERYRNTCDEVARVLTAYLSALLAGELGEIISALDQMAFAWGQPDRAGVMLPFLGASTADEAAKVVTEAATTLTSLSARIEAMEAENDRLRESMEKGRALTNQVRASIRHLNGQAYSSTLSALNDFDAALSRRATTGDGDHG